MTMNTKREIDRFYQNQTDSSRVKANIVAKYFPQYAKIIDKAGQKQIWYLDLFCGKGKYDDGNYSTPYLITKSCIEDNVLREKVRLIFNDKFYAEECEKLLNEEFDLSRFKLKPEFRNYEVGNAPKITEYLSKPVLKGIRNPNPTLLFYDPFGYKAIDTNVIAQFLKHWGNEVFLFFNIKRITAAIDNNRFDHLMKELFPKNYSTIKNNKKYGANVQERMSLIINHIEEEFKEVISGNLYMCPFRFMEEDNNATSHYVLHLTKGLKGFELVKQVYSEYDNKGACLENGTYTFDSKKIGSSLMEFDFDDPNLRVLSEKIYKRFKGKSVSALKLFSEMHPNSKYTFVHFREALRFLEQQNKLVAQRLDTNNYRESIVINANCKLDFI